MSDEHLEAQVFQVLPMEALDINCSPTGNVGRVIRGEGLEAAWVAKQQEVIDTAWFSMPTVDVLFIMQGQLRVEFELTQRAPMVLGPGVMLVLLPHTRCRVYRWPREKPVLKAG
jgi:hypothetical protein